MKTADLKFTLVESYYALLKTFSAENKAELIKRLKNSLHPKKKKVNKPLNFSAGDFIPEKSAEVLIKEIRQARTFNGNRETL